MHTTPVSLLKRLREPAAQEAWCEFVALYAPLLYHWARKCRMSGDEAADLVQDVLLVLVQQLPGFQYDPNRQFRGWLWTITLNKIRERKRRRVEPNRQADSCGIEDAEAANAKDNFDEIEYRRFVAQRALQLMQAHFEPATWKACWEQVVGGKTANAVASELGISAGSARIAKFRVLCRLRQELAGLLD